MGSSAYLGTVTDHGGNATPAWIVIAHLLFSSAPASEGALFAMALIDPLLLGLCFLCIARSFGVRTMLLCIVLFGCTDFSRFGATLVGSTLRYDWLAGLGPSRRPRSVDSPSCRAKHGRKHEGIRTAGSF